jgi:signal transduction histidine kinase
VLDGGATAAARAVALQRTPRDVVRAAVDVSRSILRTDLTFAALPEGRAMRVALSSGARDPRFHAIRVARGRGLGGQVMETGSPMRVEDYATDSRITPDFVEIVSGGEGLHGILCVPVGGADGRPAALLYAAQHAVGALGDRAVAALEQIAAFAEIGVEAAQERARELELQRLRDRQRIAAGLHDSVAQALFAIGVAASRSLRSADPDALLVALREIDRTAADARAELRETLHDLGDEHDRLAFDARLEGELRLFERRTGCTVRSIRRGEPRALPEPVEDLVLEVVLEGLRNAVKHQAARLAVVYLDQCADELHVAVQSEQGDRPPESAPGGAGTGCGLALLGERARRLRGELELDGAGGASPVLRLRLPLLAAT